MHTRTGDNLIERIRAHAADDAVVGPAANDLLSELFAGYPVDNLRRLLHSGDDAAVRTAAWILSELGDGGAAPLMDEVPALLAHPARQVRFFAIEVVLMNAGDGDGPVIAQAMELSRDYDASVRWKALGFLASAATDQLEAGAAALAAGPLRELAGWLVRQDVEAPDADDVLARLQGRDPTARLFAAAAAARLAEEDPSLLRHAATAEDEEIRSFADLRLSDHDGEDAGAGQ
ncbi:MAG TPA: hypothetical protein VFV66_08695 [Nonomuraea sp.]|nr:hypothetical protein [Nonomuraea sp.]